MLQTIAKRVPPGRDSPARKLAIWAGCPKGALSNTALREVGGVAITTWCGPVERDILLLCPHFLVF